MRDVIFYLDDQYNITIIASNGDAFYNGTDEQTEADFTRGKLQFLITKEYINLEKKGIERHLTDKGYTIYIQTSNMAHFRVSVENMVYVVVVEWYSSNDYQPSDRGIISTSNYRNAIRHKYKFTL